MPPRFYWKSLAGANAVPVVFQSSVGGGESSVDGVAGEAHYDLGVGFTLGYPINDNISLTAGCMATVNDGDPGDLQMDGFRLSFTYGWHPIVEGRTRRRSGE